MSTGKLQKNRRAKNGISGTVYKRGKKWAYMVDLGPDPLTGKRRQSSKSGYDTADEAWDALVEANNQLKSNKYVTPSRRTVREFFEEWLPLVRNSVKPTTFTNYRNYANYYVVPIIGGRYLQDLTPATISALYAHLLEKGRVRGDSNQRMYERWRETKNTTGKEPTAKDLAAIGGITYSGAVRALQRYRAGRVPEAYKSGLDPGTVDSIHIMLGRAFGDAETWKYIASNPVTESARVSRVRKRHQVWTPDQLKAFLAEAKKERLYAMWLTFATTGMRRSEAAGALVRLADPAERVLTVWETRVVADGQAEDSDGKTARSRRPLALDKQTARCLQRHLDMLAAEREQFDGEYHDGGYLFCWPDGRPIYPETITGRFNRLVDRAGVPPIRLHDVRHTYATTCLRAGIHPKIVSARLGHAKVAFTLDSYTEDVPELHHDAAESVSGLFVEPETDETDETEPPLDLP